ncbi:hypothetical protein D3C75_906530 [compost metagenome]
MTFVEDVVDDQHVTVDERHFRLGFPEQLAAAGLVAVAGGVQVAGFQRELQVGQQFAGEDQAAIHHAEHHRVLVVQVLADLLADFGDGRFDFGFVVKAVCLAHDLTDVLEISGHCALQGGFWKSGQRYASARHRSSIYGLTSRMTRRQHRLNRLI